MRRAVWLALLVAVLVGASSALPALAQEAAPEIGISTNFPGRAIGPGDSASFALTVTGPEGERVALEVTGVPDGWSTKLTGGGGVISEVIIHAAATVTPTLEVTAPAEAPEGDYTITVVARGDSGTARLDLDIEVAQEASGGVALTTDYPTLRGAADSTFSFTLNLKNDTPQEIEFGLSGEGPSGWVIDVQPSSQSRAATITLAAGESGSITAEADPPDTTVAGEYAVVVRAEGGGEVAEAQLGVEVTGNYGLSLDTADGLLSFSVEAGSTTELSLVLTNTGTAPQTDLSLRATAPSGWKVEFTPDGLDGLAAGVTGAVTATVTAADDAVAGDYAMAVTVSSAESSDSIELRGTVETSALWGLVGIAVIVLALGALGVVFWRFGRR